MEQQEAWGDLDPSAQQVSLAQFEKLCETAADQYAKIKDLEDIVEEENKVLTGMKNKIKEYMNQLDKKKYSANAATISLSDKLSVKTPKDPDEKAKFYAWLKEQNLYDALITVPSATLNKMYNDQFKEHKDPDFEIPGVGKATHYQTLSLRRK